MKKWTLGLIALLSYLIFMLILTPAAWWLKLVALPPQLKLGQVQGTLSKGSISSVQYRHLVSDSIHWQWHGWALFSGKLKFSVQSGSMQQAALPYLNGSLSYGFSGLRLQNTVLRSPAASLLPFMSLPLPVNASGNLLLDISGYQQGQPWCETLAGYASWQDARLQPPASSWLDLGDIAGSLQCEQGGVVLHTDGENRLGLILQARLADNAKLTVNGSMKPEASLPQEVHQAMQFLGRPNAEGRYRISF